MSVRIHFAGLVPGRPLEYLAWAAFARDERLAGGTTIHFGLELADVFEHHFQVAPSFADCDVVVYPHCYEDGPETDSVAEAARAAGKPCLFFGINENLPPSRLRYGTLYRSSIFERLPHERMIPVFINDPVTEVTAGIPDPLAWEPRPRVGFCGYVGTAASRLAFRLLGARQKADGLDIRAAVLAALRRDPRIDCDFLTRATYLGSATLSAFDKNHPLVKARDAFLANLFRCPYNLAIRGKGNHSVRFYEILAAGRIPLFLNTKCVLPLEQEIDWKAHMLWCEADDLDRIGSVVAAGHAGRSPDDFRRLQQANREFWERRLKPEPFFTHVLETVAAGRPAP
jgi:hypothetical protein